jgi:hypothetical protein
MVLITTYFLYNILFIYSFHQQSSFTKWDFVFLLQLLFFGAPIALLMMLQIHKDEDEEKEKGEQHE